MTFGHEILQRHFLGPCSWLGDKEGSAALTCIFNLIFTQYFTQLNYMTCKHEARRQLWRDILWSLDNRANESQKRVHSSTKNIQQRSFHDEHCLPFSCWTQNGWDKLKLLPRFTWVFRFFCWHDGSFVPFCRCCLIQIVKATFFKTKTGFTSWKARLLFGSGEHVSSEWFNWCQASREGDCNQLWALSRRPVLHAQAACH